MKYQVQLYLTILIFTFLACNDKEDPVNKTVSKYDACCGVEPVEFVQDSYYVYVPNSFTPNGDGINDLFLFYISNNIDSVKFYLISSTGSDALEILLFAENFSKNDWQSYVWDGLTKNLEFYKGKFTYAITLKTKDEKIIAVHGSGCSIICDDEAKVFKDRKGCYFPTQATIEGKLDSLIPTNEDHCFMK
jgi:hypothetical protein